MASKAYKGKSGLRCPNVQIHGDHTAPPNMQLERKVSMGGKKKGK